ncbi:MAG: AAA family ATPase [Alphaproteobacteria bacterium]|uniref:ATPase AAA-type core domain-containing protein n=1 Tax=viral metagenome TaxID=1070528 RepID=A0A6C0HRD8_9ZZZZ|nr:AAA family ATPase [Alphaproteobacteria bacterium]
MEHNLFINKFQPLYFKDFEVDEEMVQILKTLIDMNNLNILFIGDMGCGKTSILNALIREYYNGISDKQYADNILQINNLKEQGINYYRNDVKTFCQTCSIIKNKKKIVVLDDIDLINEQSQQVFRNCIDKFSHNVHFISSCSNIQKVIESLQSRFTIIKIKPLQRNNLAKIMKKIKFAENIEISEDAENFILDICNNTVKILINYMEKFKLLSVPVTFELVNNVCTNISFFSFQKYTEHLKDKNLVEAIKLIYSIYDKGYSVMDILDNYFLFIKTTNMLTEDEKYMITPFICKYITIFHNIHEDEIELALFTNNLINHFV